MRILFVSQPRDPILASPAQAGSVAIVTRALAHELAARNSVTIVAPRTKGQAREETAQDGVRILRVRSGARTLNRLLDFLSGLDPAATPHLLSDSYHATYQRAVVRLVAHERPDLVHVMSLAALIERLAHAFPDIPRLLHLHDGFLLTIDRERARRRLSAATLVLVPSGWLARAFVHAFPEFAEKIRVLPNGVDTDHFCPAPTGSGAQAPRLLLVGRLSPEKGVHVAIAAFAQLAPRHPDLVLELVGEPGLLPYAYLARLPRTPALEEALAFYGRSIGARLYRELLLRARAYLDPILAPLPPPVRARVHLLGALPHDRLPEAYRAATLLLAPSVWDEPFGIPVVEAMATAVPVVASAGGAFAELLEGPDHESAGILVPQGDARALADAVARLLADDRHRRQLGDSGRKRALRCFSWITVARRLQELISTVSAARCAP